MQKTGYVYILASKGKRLYVGVTSELHLRVKQHKEKVHADSFTAKYNIDRLVYFEQHALVLQAIKRESQIKNMHRIEKIALIVATNPDWKDLSDGWGKMAPVFDERKMRPPVKFVGE